MSEKLSMSMFASKAQFEAAMLETTIRAAHDARTKDGYASEYESFAEGYEAALAAQTPPPAVLPVVAITDEKILWLAGDHGICMVGEPNSPDRDDYTFDKASILAFARELTENSAASGGRQDRGEV